MDLFFSEVGIFLALLGFIVSVCLIVVFNEARK